MRIALALVLAAALLDCKSAPQGAAAGTGQAEAVVVGDAAAAKAAVGKRVRVSGTAGNAKLGAVVRGSGVMVYCLDRPEWPGDRDGQTVTVEGTLEYTSEFMAKTDPSGAISAGTGGPVYVLRKSDLVP